MLVFNYRYNNSLCILEMPFVKYLNVPIMLMVKYYDVNQ